MTKRHVGYTNGMVKFWEYSPTWIYRQQPEEVKKKISESNKKVVRTEEWKNNIHLHHANVSGINNPMFGKKHTMETKNKMKQKAMGRTAPFKGRKHSVESKKKMSLHHADVKGMNNPNFGHSRQHTVETRKKMSKSHKGLQIGKKNPAWKGGIASMPYTNEFKNNIRYQIRVRDNFICQLCNNYIKYPSVHHIDYNKKNNSADNLICLCRVCHAKTNTNRGYWELTFRELMKNRYGGSCNDSKKN